LSSPLSLSCQLPALGHTSPSFLTSCHLAVGPGTWERNNILRSLCGLPTQQAFHDVTWLSWPNVIHFIHRIFLSCVPFSRPLFSGLSPSFITRPTLQCPSGDRPKGSASQCAEWGEIFASCSSDKGLISRIYKEL
jgi:hypothetical protein